MKPFDLEEALAGEPVKLRDGRKAFVKVIIKQPKGLEHYAVIGHALNGIHEEFLHWATNGNCMPDDISDDDIVGMWEKPKRYINGIEVPEPVTLDMLRDVGGKYYWIVDFLNEENVTYLYFNINKDIDIKLILKGLVFETKEGAEAMAKALLNYKVEVRND